MSSSSLEIKDIIEEYLQHPNWNQVLEIGMLSKFTSEFPKEVQHVEKWLAKRIEKLLNKKMLGFGGSRVLFREKEFVVKIPLESLGSVENENDMLIWNEMPDEGKKHFLPVLAGNENIVVYPYVETFDYAEFMEYENEAAHIREELEKIGIHPDDCEEGRWDQWGLYNGKLVIIDSGRCYLTKAV